jgi:protein required for attachment to host cells
MDPPTDPHDKAEARFADRIAGRLEAAHREGRFRKLALIAPPAMLGRLRPAIDGACGRSLELEWDRDLTHLSSQEIAERLAREREARRGSAAPRG